MQPSAAKSKPPHKLTSQYAAPIKTAPCCKNATVSNENVEKVVNAPIMPVPNPVVSQDGHLACLITKKVMNDSKKQPHKLAIRVSVAQKFCASTYRIAPPKNAKHATLIFSANFTKITPWLLSIRLSAFHVAISKIHDIFDSFSCKKGGWEKSPVSCFNQMKCRTKTVDLRLNLYGCFKGDAAQAIQSKSH